MRLRYFLPWLLILLTQLSWANTPRILTGGLINNESQKSVIHLNTEQLFDETGVLIFDWSNANGVFINYQSGNFAIDIDGAQLLQDSVSVIPSVQWGARDLVDEAGTGVLALRWDSTHRQLIDASNQLVMDWGGYFLSYPVSQNVSIDWNQGLLQDDTGDNNESIDWKNRGLIFGSGGTTFTALDWEQFLLVGTSGTEKIDWSGTTTGISVGPGVSAPGVTNGAVTLHDGHLVSKQTTAPTTTVKAAAGTGASCALDANATDTKGVITLVTTATSPSNGPLCDINFNKSHGVAPTCLFSDANATAAAQMVILQFFITSTVSKFTMTDAVTDATGHTYVWNYHCFE